MWAGLAGRYTKLQLVEMFYFLDPVSVDPRLYWPLPSSSGVRTRAEAIVQARARVQAAALQIPVRSEG